MHNERSHNVRNLLLRASNNCRLTPKRQVSCFDIREPELNDLHHVWVADPETAFDTSHPKLPETVKPKHSKPVSVRSSDARRYILLSVFDSATRAK